ncbi:restriction endonuclease subunit S [Acutalibacter sp. 1XD8-36]|uniref:restriction endonuclease subunit S n=1 Tax=Acutalibacter sp. 1XD8-36 TaxID=2320852 RepID=UPI00261A1B70|nr:restriction endonuclease subunit S [Acutalibacter sp. 1XD8-36]
MARGKKAAKELSPEEKLQQALVPVEEQPYPIPENWCWIYWGNIGEFTAGSTFKNEYQGFAEYQIPFYKVGSLKYSDVNGILYDNSNTINEEIRAKLKAALIPSQSIIFAKIGEAIRLSRRSINAVPCCIDNNLMAFQAKECFWHYAFYWTLGLDLYTYTNATTVPAIRKSDLEAIPFPLPPFSEQHRIVSRLESLFAKLDESKEKAQAVVEGFELRKSAILHKAFTGELTERWRSKRGADKWRTSTFGKYTNSQYGYTESATQEPVGPKFLRITDIQDGVVNWDKVPYCAISKDDFEKYSMKQGDIVIARTGATTGKSYLIADDVKAVFASYLIRLTMKQAGLMTRYLYYFMQSPSYWQQITEFSAGIAQPGVNAKKLQKIELPIPSVEEQEEVVVALDKILKKEQQAKEAAEAVLAQIDTMKKAILARAFRGELGTNDPAEEWAGEMVKEIL